MVKSVKMLSLAGKLLARNAINGKTYLIQELAVATAGSNRSYHIACGNRNDRQQIGSAVKLQNRFINPIAASVLVRNISTDDAGRSLLDTIPEPPPIPAAPEISDIVANVAANGEPTFASLGLGGWTPVGIVQNCMEFLHVTCDIPWWGVIAIGTICVRTLLFPLVIASQRNAAQMNNHLSQMQVPQMKITEARQAGDSIDSARYAQEMVVFMKKMN